MEQYVVGSVAELVAGTLTPSRTGVVTRPRTPVKHQPSPHVTPRVDASGVRDALLSPSVLKRKAIVKKSPKRIFEQTDLDKSMGSEAGESKSPKADKVKKNLDLDTEKVPNGIGKVKTPKRMLNSFTEVPLEDTSAANIEGVVSSESNKKNKKKKNKKAKANSNQGPKNETTVFADNSVAESLKTDGSKITTTADVTEPTKKKNKKSKKKRKDSQTEAVETVNGTGVTAVKKVLKKGNKNKKNKNKKKQNVENNPKESSIDKEQRAHKDSSSEHESDDDIESETEQDVKQILDNGPIEDEESSDDEDKMKSDEIKTPKKPKTPKEEKGTQEKGKNYVMDDEEIKRTLFVGNVPISKKIKKDVKNIFSKYGDIESVRIRTVPVKDMRMTPKVALIKNELHPERTSVNVYVKYVEMSSVGKALAENNRVMGEHHLRVSRSDTSGDVHDPRLTLFVGNIPFGIEDETLRSKFEKCGEIESVRIVRDKASQIGKGFGYVNFTSCDGVELALTLSEEDLSIKNRILRLRRYSLAPKGQKVKGRPPPGQNSRGKPPQGQNQRSQGQNQRSQGQNQRQQGHNQWGKPPQGQFQRGKPPQGQWSKEGFKKPEAGAMQRINNKRKFQDNPVAGNTAPPQKKKKSLDQPIKEKKSKKEFVGLTAEKKKNKKKFNKDQKHKKKLGEILTKS